jgi:hypothetical protein
VLRYLPEEKRFIAYPMPNRLVCIEPEPDGKYGA